MGGGFREWASSSSEEAATHPVERCPFRVRPSAKPEECHSYRPLTRPPAGRLIMEISAEGSQLAVADPLNCNVQQADPVGPALSPPLALRE
jgi:hypothetical protein